MTSTMSDIGLSTFSLFFMQSESFLSHQRRLQEGGKMSNRQSLFDMPAFPTDTHIRAMLDLVDPSRLQPAFDGALDARRRHGGLASSGAAAACWSRSTVRNTSARKSSAARSA